MRRVSNLRWFGRWGPWMKLTLAIMLIILAVHVYIEFKSVYMKSQKFSLLNARVHQALVHHKDRPDFVKVMKSAYKQHVVKISEVRRELYPFKIEVEVENKKQEKLLEEYVASYPQAIILLVQVGVNMENVEDFTNNLRSIMLRNSDAIVVFVLEDYHHGIYSYIRNTELQAPVVTLVNPYCTHLHPIWFPGDEPRPCSDPSPSCEYDDKATLVTFRDSSRLRQKYSWTWSSNLLYSKTKHSKTFSGFIINLDDADFLLPDAFHVARLLHDMRLEQCPACAISLMSPWANLQLSKPEGFSNLIANESDYNSVHVFTLRGSYMHGISFGQSLFDALRTCQEKFCHIQESSWRWSILKAFQTRCFSGSALILVPRASRLFHGSDNKIKNLKTCHTKKVSSNFTLPEQIKKALNNERNPEGRDGSLGIQDPNVNIVCNDPEQLFNSKFAFPKKLYVEHLKTQIEQAKTFHAFTGDSPGTDEWNDSRDKIWCQRIFMNL